MDWRPCPARNRAAASPSGRRPGRICSCARCWPRQVYPCPRPFWPGIPIIGRDLVWARAVSKVLLKPHSCDAMVLSQWDEPHWRSTDPESDRDRDRAFVRRAGKPASGAERRVPCRRCRRSARQWPVVSGPGPIGALDSILMLQGLDVAPTAAPRPRRMARSCSTCWTRSATGFWPAACRARRSTAWRTR